MLHFAAVLVRLDKDNAEFVLRNAKAHRRIFKRRKSYAAVVNEMLRDVILERPKVEVVTPKP